MAKKIVLIVFGIVILLVGLAVTALGIAGLTVGGRSGSIQSGYHAVSTPTYAFVSNAQQLRRGQGFELNSGHATLHVDARNGGEPLFVGVGPAQQVTSYLAGSAYATVTDVNFGPFSLETRQSAGNATPARPADQSFWVAQASGASPSLTWRIANGQYRLVVMNADASAGVRTDARLGLQIPGLFGTALGATIGGGVLTLLGIGLLIWGIAAKRRGQFPGYGQPATYGPPAGYPPPGGYPAGGYPPSGGYPPTTEYPPTTGYPPATGYPPPAGSAPGTGYPPAAGSVRPGHVGLSATDVHRSDGATDVVEHSAVRISAHDAGQFGDRAERRPAVDRHRPRRRRLHLRGRRRSDGRCDWRCDDPTRLGGCHSGRARSDHYAAPARRPPQKPAAARHLMRTGYARRNVNVVHAPRWTWSPSPSGTGSFARIGSDPSLTYVPLAESRSTTDQPPAGCGTRSACAWDTAGSSGGPDRSICGSMPRDRLRRPIRIWSPSSAKRRSGQKAGKLIGSASGSASSCMRA